jgi:hypothetical protein
LPALAGQGRSFIIGAAQCVHAVLHLEIIIRAPLPAVGVITFVLFDVFKGVPLVAMQIESEFHADGLGFNELNYTPCLHALIIKNAYQIFGLHDGAVNNLVILF